MKKKLKQTFNILIYIAFVISIISHITKNNILNNNKKILKEMSESTQLTNLNKNIEQLNSSHTEYANHIQTSKQKLANAINMYPNNNATEENTLEELSTMIENLTTIPESTYYYESGTEGNSSTIVRYKKIGTQYYICNEHGIVASGTSATDISSLTLVPYTSTTSKNLSSGSAGYSSGTFYLGDGSDNTAYLEQGFTNASTQIINLGEVSSETTFDISIYSGYENLSEENFFFKPTQLLCDEHGGWGSGSDYTLELSISYDKTTGTVTFPQMGLYRNANAYVYCKGNAYLIY